MKYSNYYVEYNGKSNCVIRSFCKLYNLEYIDVYNELVSISNELNCNYNDICVFEEFMKRRNTLKIKYGNNLLIKDINLDKGSYIIFCWDKKDIYHMVPCIDSTIYDKDDRFFDLYIISIYEKK